MKYIEYPKWLYHAELPAVVVETPDEHAALGEGWEDSPAAFGADFGDAEVSEEPQADAPGEPTEAAAEQPDEGAPIPPDESAKKPAKKSRK